MFQFNNTNLFLHIHIYIHCHTVYSCSIGEMLSDEMIMVSPDILYKAKNVIYL